MYTKGSEKSGRAGKGGGPDMSLANIQDNLVKNFMVQPFQSRGEEAQRVQEQVRAQYQAEQTRQADEAVTDAKRTNQEGIRNDQERKKDKYESKRRSAKNPDDEEDEETPSESSNFSVPGDVHRIDIVV